MLFQKTKIYEIVRSVFLVSIRYFKLSFIFFTNGFFSSFTNWKLTVLFVR